MRSHRLLSTLAAVTLVRVDRQRITPPAGLLLKSSHTEFNPKLASDVSEFIASETQLLDIAEQFDIQVRAVIHGEFDGFPAPQQCQGPFSQQYMLHARSGSA